MKQNNWSNEHLYEAFDKLIRHFEQWIKTQSIGLRGFESSIVKQRITQRMVQLLFYPFGTESVKRRNNDQYPFPVGGEKLELNQLTIDTASGAIGLRLQMVFKLLLDFFWQWWLALKGLVKGFFTKKWEKPVTILIGVSNADINFTGSENGFIEFCKNGPVEPLAKANFILVQSPVNKQIEGAFLQYTTYPVYTAAEKTPLGFFRRSWLLVKHLLLPFYFAAKIISNRLFAVLGKDFVQSAIITAIDKRQFIQSVVTTNSEFFQQYLWMRQPQRRSFKVHEVHYSQVIQMEYHDQQVQADFPAFRHVSVDERWVWTEGFKEYLQKIGQPSSIHVAGPILWYLPSTNTTESKTGLRISVFDITPAYQHVADSISILRYYYNTERMIRFVADIISVCDEYEKQTGDQVEILFKSKRDSKKGFHDHRYEEFIDHCEKTHPNFKVLSTSSNLFSLLRETDLSVSIPFTSVPYVASSIHRPAVYFDPGNDLVFTHEKTPYIQTASNTEELLNVFKSTLTNKSIA